MTIMPESELNARGLSALENALAVESEAVISVEGRHRFVVMDWATYNALRECELEMALSDARAEHEAGRFTTETTH